MTLRGPQASCTDGQVAAIQSSLVFLSSYLTFAEGSRSKKTVGTQQSLIRILDYLTPFTVDLEPHSFLSSPFPIWHATPAIMLSNTVHNPVLLGLYHRPTFP